ncbi:MAG: pitrilysin family protein [Candidatus Omnitrophota bacterium]
MEVILRKHPYLLINLAAVIICILSPVETLAVPGNIDLPSEAVSKKILENGLTVLSVHVPAEKLAAIHATISAGSSSEDEYMGSGITHFVEHMVFKGTGKRGVGDIEKEIKSYGGIVNGSTSQDLTDYYIVVPAKYLKEALAILKDMLLNASFDKVEFEKEKEVILNEIKLNSDEPQSRLMKLLDETAYIAHPYKYPPIGYEKNFTALKREDLFKYYNRKYVPNRMVVTVVSGIDRESVIRVVEDDFRDFRAPNYGAPDIHAIEPAQIAARDAVEELPANLAYLAIGFHSTSVLDKDLFAMDVLSMVLGRGNNSRLNNEIVKNMRLAHSVSCWNYTPRDPGLFVINAILDKESLAPAKDAILKEVKKIRTVDIGDEELEAAKRMVLSDYIFSLEAVDARARDISSGYILTGSYDFSAKYVDGIQSVTVEDVKKAADIYLTETNMTVVRLVPKGYKEDMRESAPQAVIIGTIGKTVMTNGLRILTREDRSLPVVSITLAMMGGLTVEKENKCGLSRFVSEMLLKGTSKRKEEDIAGAIESLGGRIAAFSGFNSFGLNIEVLKPDTGKALDILKDIMTDSIFPQDQIDKEKELTLAAIKAEDDDIFRKGSDILRKELFGKSPYGFRRLGTSQTISSISRDDLLEFYKRYCVAGNMVISISGDMAPTEMADRVKRLFGDVRTAKTDIAAVMPQTLRADKKADVEMDRQESLIMIGFITTDIKNTDKYALSVLGSVLSGSSGRLFSNLRGKLSLAYALGCAQKQTLDTGYFVLYAATSKNQIGDARKALALEMADINTKGPDEVEVDFAKRELLTKFDLETQANSFYSYTATLDELYGLGYDNVYKYKERIEEVTKEDVKRVANRYFNRKAHAEVVISSKGIR